MNKEQIDEIALRVANKSVDFQRNDIDSAGLLWEYTHALLAELAKVQEPVSQVTCQIYGHVVGACDACNTHAENDVNETNKILADNYLKLTCGSSPSVLDVESKATEIEKYKALCDQMGNALKTLWLAAPTDVECNNMSHPKPKQHRYDETCQLVGEYHEAITGAGKALEAWRAMK